MPRLSYARTATPFRSSSACRSGRYARVVGPDPGTHETAGCAPALGGIVSVPDSVTFPLRKRTSSWRCAIRVAGAPAIVAPVAPNLAAPASGARVAKPEPTTNREPDG